MLIYVVLSWVLIRADDSGVHEINDNDNNDGNDDDDDIERYVGSLLDQRWCLKKFDETKVILMLSWCWSWCWSALNILVFICRSDDNCEM